MTSRHAQMRKLCGGFGRIAKSQRRFPRSADDYLLMRGKNVAEADSNIEKIFAGEDLLPDPRVLFFSCLFNYEERSKKRGPGEKKEFPEKESIRRNSLPYPAFI